MRIVFFFILIFAGLLGNAQFGNNHPFSSPNTLETALGGLKVNRGLINTIYADTATANNNPIKNYPAAQIWVNDTVYIRNITATRWVAIGAVSGGGGSGTVTSFSIVTANGFSGSVANSTTTPALTITTSITGLLKGDGTAMSAAVAGTDFVAPSGTYFIGTTSNALNRASASQTLTGVSIDGNAATATALQTARTIQGVSFDGTANITIATASEGLSISGIDLRFGGPIGSPSIFSTERTVNTNRLIMHWTNGIAAESGGAFWQFSHRPYSPFQFISSDTVTVDDQLQNINRPLSGLYARRIVYFNTGIYKTQQSYGHYLGQTFSFADSALGKTQGGDYQQAVITELRIKPRGTGRQVFRTGHAAGGNLLRQEGISALVANFYMDGDGTNPLRLNGTGVAFTPYLVMFSGTTDTADNFVYVQPNSFVGGGAKVLKAFAFAPVGSAIFNPATVDSAFLIFDTTRRTFSYIAGNMLFGPGDSTITQAKLRVNGSTVLNGWSGYLANVATDYTARSFTDKNYVDSAIAAIPAGGSPFLPVTGTGTATGAVIGALAGNTLSINQGANSFLSIDPTAGAETSLLRAYNTTAGDNIAQFLTATTNADAVTTFLADFNGGATSAQILAQADVTTASLSYTADLHTLNGAVGITGITTLTGNLLTATDNTYDIGDATNSFQGGYFRTIHLDGATSGGISINSDALGNSILGTTLTGVGVLPSTLPAYLDADFTLANSTSAQTAFPTGMDVWTLQSNTTYEFELVFNVLCGTTSASMGVGFSLGTATLTSIKFITFGFNGVADAQQTAQMGVYRNSVTPTAATAAAVNAGKHIWAKGIIRVNTGGTITPQVIFSADPTGTITMEDGSWIRITPMGSGSMTTLGNPN